MTIQPDFSKTLVVNLYAGPGTGKSTTMGGLFHLLKVRGYNVEQAPEYAKDKVWEGSTAMLGNQIAVFGKQHHRLWRLIGKVDVVVTDSPLLLANYYGREFNTPEFTKAIIAEHRKFRTLDVFLNRVKKYNPAGRMQTEEEAIQIDTDLKVILTDARVPVIYVTADEDAPEVLFHCVLKELSGDVIDKSLPLPDLKEDTWLCDLS